MKRALKHSIIIAGLCAALGYAGSLQAQQLEVLLNPNTKAYRLELYAWFPTKDNTSSLTASLNQGKAQLALEALEEGVYTLYAIGQQGMAKAPFIDVIITKNKSLQLYWDTHTGWYAFKNSELNTGHKNNLHCLNELAKAQAFYNTQLANASTKAQKREYKYQIDYLAVKQQKRYKAIRQTQSPWDDYIIYKDAYSNHSALTLETFWEGFPKAQPHLYYTPLLSQVIARLRQLLAQKHPGQTALIDTLLLEQLLAHLGTSPTGLRYLEHWLYANYNTNATNAIFVKGLQGLAQKLPQNQSIAQDLAHYEPLSSGQPIGLKELDETFGWSKDLQPHRLVFFSNSCGYCHDLLQGLNTPQRTTPVLAVSVLEDTQATKDQLKAQYPHIAFAFPSNASALKAQYAKRGTPSAYTVYKHNGQWYIQ